MKTYSHCLPWFLTCLNNAIDNAESILENTLNKSQFWKQFADESFNERQIIMLNVLFDGLKGKLTTSKWAKMTKCSQDTATRDIQQLIEKDVLIKGEGGGRNTHYLLRGYPINFLD